MRDTEVTSKEEITEAIEDYHTELYRSNETTVDTKKSNNSYQCGI